MMSDFNVTFSIDEQRLFLHDISYERIEEQINELNENISAVADASIVKTATMSTADLDITDPSGNVIARFEDGHIKTKEFDSSDQVGTVRNIWTGRCSDQFPSITQNKTVVLDDPKGFSLTNGVIIAVRNMENGRTVTDPCLNVNGTGNIPVYVPYNVPLEDYYLNRWGGVIHFFKYVSAGGGRWLLGTIDPVMWENLVDAAAPKESPAFSGTPTAPTASAGTNNTQVATTAFVRQEIASENAGVVKTAAASTADLDITDYYGNVIARFGDGHIKTKEFDSSDLYPLIGKKWTCIGDSLTEVNVRTTMHYHDYIAEMTGVTVVNHGHSGAGYYARSFDYAFMNEVQRIPTDSDVITIFGSINDIFIDEIPLGDVTDTTSSTLCGCINITIDNLYARIPVAYLGIVTPTPCWYQAGGSIDDWTPSNPGNALETYSEALVEICRRKSIPCLDLYHESNLRPQVTSFRTLAFSKDSGNGIHPDETGHKLIAARFMEFIKTLILC